VINDVDGENILKGGGRYKICGWSGEAMGVVADISKRELALYYLK